MIKIIAEIGVNHDGSVEKAKSLIQAAKAAGATAVKFQTFKTELLVNEDTNLARYQEANIGSGKTQYEMLKKLELTADHFLNLKKFCEQVNIEFISTPFDHQSLALLKELSVDTIKISSGDLTNYPLIWDAAQDNSDLIISTGMASLIEVTQALRLARLSKSGCEFDYAIKALTLDEHVINNRKFLGDITVLQCTSNYPADINILNLEVIRTYKEVYGVTVGFSDHTSSIDAAGIAVAVGARVIEKHLTLDKSSDGPDHMASIEPNAFKKMVENIKRVEDMLGDGEKVPSAIEIENSRVSRRRLVAKSNIEIGQLFTINNLEFKRSNAGLLSTDFLKIVNTKAKNKYIANSPINDDEL